MPAPRSPFLGPHRLVDEIAHLAVQPALCGALRDPQGFDPARGEHDVGVRAPGSDHHVLEQRAELRRVPRGALVVAGEEIPAELRERPDRPGTNQRREVVELAQVVLHRRRGQQHQVAGIEVVDELPSQGQVVAQAVGFVHHHHVVVGAAHPAPVPLVPRGLERRDHQRVPAPLARRTPGHHEVELELLPQLGAPLLAQRRRHQHQRGAHRSAQQIFLEHDAGLDGLAESDLVRQDRAPVELAHDLEARAHLVRKALDPAQRIQGDQPLGLGPSRPALGLDPQVEVGRGSDPAVPPARDQGLALSVPDPAHRRCPRRRGRGGSGGSSRPWRRRRGRGLAVDDLPIARRGQPPQLAAEHHFQHLAPAIGVHFDHQPLAELRMLESLAHQVSGLGQFHSSNSSPLSGTRTSVPVRSRRRAASASAASSSP